MRDKRRLHICAIDSYWGVDSSRGGNGTQYVNHSCEPNCFMRVTRGHINIYALRDIDRKSTRLNSSHANISYAVFCLKKKKKEVVSHSTRKRGWGRNDTPTITSRVD